MFKEKDSEGKAIWSDGETMMKMTGKCGDGGGCGSSGGGG